jgi:myo-inositol-1(or 4)-monophosphatase
LLTPCKDGILFITPHNNDSMQYNYPEMARDMVHVIEEGISPLVGTTKACTPTGAGGETAYIDRVAEDAAITYLRENDIECLLITEESGKIGKGDVTIILDPLDGTTNALSGIPFYCVSLAFWGEKKYGFVKNLCTTDVYEAFEYGTPLKNGKKMCPPVKNVTDVASGYIGEGFEKVLPLVNAWRCFGSLALELCYVAEGKLSALVDLREKARVVDIAGAQLIAEAAGITITDEKGKDPFRDTFFDGKFIGKKIICAVPEIHEQFLNALR